MAIGAFCLSLSFVFGCGERQPEPTPARTAPTRVSTPATPARIAPAPIESSTVPPQETITVMTYNILKGAGADAVAPGNKEWAAQLGFPGNRLPTVLEVIRTADPDILGIQEANQWNLGSPPVARRVADQLGMDYFLSVSTNPESGFASVVLFTKFDIKEAESYSSHFSRAALRAELVTPAGKSIHVFVVHLDGASDHVREAESAFLVGEMQAYVDDFSMLIGDMNFLDRPTSIGAILRQAGWSHPLGPSQNIDQIWTSSVLQPHVQPAPDIPSELTSRASDHRPVAVEIGIP